jgi:hypothetical protein
VLKKRNKPYTTTLAVILPKIVNLRMSSKKKRSRIRQTRTDFQKVFDKYPNMIQPFSWSNRIPEFIHISMTFVNYDYSIVEKDFFKISDFVNENYVREIKFHFNLSDALKIIITDINFLNFIKETCFKNAFEQIIFFYQDYLKIPTDFNPKEVKNVLLLGYKSILKGRSKTSILCKYLMIKYTQKDNEDVTGLFKLENTEEILAAMNISRIMAMFPPSIGTSRNLDLEFCEDIWYYNFNYSPFIDVKDDKEIEEKHYKEMEIESLKNEFENIFKEFKKIPLVNFYNPLIAETNMGFLARICNLSFDCEDLVKNHRAEIAELVFRTSLESFIIGSWLINEKDVSLYERYREFSVGREKFFGERIKEVDKYDDLTEGSKKMLANTIEEAGANSNDVAIERGDIFELNLNQMADSVWGKDNIYYFLYKRASDVIHGHWRVISKYHLTKSGNPMHNGLYFYNENPNRYAGLIPAYFCFILGISFIRTVINDIEIEQEELKTKIYAYEDKIWEEYMNYYKKYVTEEI